MRDLNWYVERAFRNIGYSRGIASGRGDLDIEHGKYLEIPLNKDIIEIPVFFLSFFTQLIQNKTDKVDKIIIDLYHSGYEPAYKTLNRYMLDMVSIGYEKHLIKCSVKRNKEDYPYYVMGGFIADCDFNPIFIAGWQLTRKLTEENVYSYNILKPFCKIDPVVLEQKDPMQNYIVKKYIPALCSSTFPNGFNCPNVCMHPDYSPSLHVEIGNCLPAIKTTERPSISLSNSSLAQLVIDNINNVTIV